MAALNNRVTYGYLLDDGIQGHLKTRTVIRIDSLGQPRGGLVKVLVLGPTLMRLRGFLLEYAPEDVMRYADVLSAYGKIRGWSRRTTS